MPTPEAKRIRSAINRLALKPMSHCRAEPKGFIRAGDQRVCCCFCSCPVHYGEEYRNAGSIRAHEFCFKAVAQEYKSR
jgi:hypothetical protein